MSNCVYNESNHLIRNIYFELYGDKWEEEIKYKHRCLLCDYKSTCRSNLQKHFKTLKHLKNTL